MWYCSFYDDLLDHQYVALAIQYFILARLGSRLNFNPVSGSLYHLSIELLLKSYLVKNGFTADELASKQWGHSLIKLWKKFKSKVDDEKLSSYDLHIQNLDAWERIRYLSLKGGYQATEIAIIEGHSPGSYLREIEKIDFHSRKRFVIHIDDMDSIFSVFFTVLKIPAEELLKVPDFRNGLSIYQDKNKHDLVKQIKRVYG